MNMIRDEPEPEHAAKRQNLELSIDSLPDDLLIEILCRMPHRYLFQCKCICRHWLSLISNPYFIRGYINHLQSRPVEQPWAFMYFNFLEKTCRYFLKEDHKELTPKLISQYYDFKSSGFSLKFLPCYQVSEPITIVKTFNDLMLCCVDKFNRSECVYYICNPQTKQWVALPPTPPLLYGLQCSEVEFICEPYYKIQQGRVILNRQIKFKVMRFLTTTRCSTQVKLQIFSSETGLWNVTTIPLLAKFRRLPPFKIIRSLFSKEKLTLIALSRTNRLIFITLDDNFEHCVQRVQFRGDMFRKYPFDSIMHLSSSRQGSPRVTQICINLAAHARFPFLVIWELHDMVRWKLQHKVFFRNMVSRDPWISEHYLKDRLSRNKQFPMPLVLGFHPRNDNLLYLNLNCDDRMALYNISENTLVSVNETWWRPSFPWRPLLMHFNDVSQLVLPLWPTPLPQISDARSSLSLDEAHKLFTVVFGDKVSKDILARWSNQGIRFSSDPETSMGLVQNEGASGGVLAAIQAFVLKHIFFYPRVWKDASNNFSSITDDVKINALVRGLIDILFVCGSRRRVVIASLSIHRPEGIPEDETIPKALEGLSIESALDLQKIIVVETHTLPSYFFKRLKAMIPVFQSRMGVLLFLISALLSRGLDNVQTDRDHSNIPLVTAPFEEIINLLLRGQAVSSRGMILKGISRRVEVGFLTRLESRGLCKVGQHWKCPRWPIWIVGGESHYNVLFALETEMKERESQAFVAQDQFSNSDKSLGKDLDLYHFNGFAKSSSQLISTPLVRLTKLRVSVPPGCTPHEYITHMHLVSSLFVEEHNTKTSKPELSQHRSS